MICSQFFLAYTNKYELINFITKLFKHKNKTLKNKDINKSLIKLQIKINIESQK
jgi:hypothetical protein